MYLRITTQIKLLCVIICQNLHRNKNVEHVKNVFVNPCLNVLNICQINDQNQNKKHCLSIFFVDEIIVRKKKTFEIL